MAAFSYQQYHPLLLDSGYLPCSPRDMISHASSCFVYNTLPNNAIPNPSHQAEPRTFDSSSSSLDSLRLINVLSEDPPMISSSFMVDPHGGGEAPPAPPAAFMEKKRKTRDCTTLQNSPQPKDAKGKSRKQKKHSTDDKGESKPSAEEAPTGYIHVRARRGQATDSHSLAERVRREKIRERMNLLQGLVPGCDKITGKALMLDEIINYVQSLQNQVEFLSMKLASMNPIVYDFGVDLDGNTDQRQKMGSMSQDSLEMPSGLQASPIQHIDLEEAIRNYPMIETSAPLLLHGQGPMNLTQDNGSLLMQVDDRRQELLNLVVFNNMCSFQ